MSNISSSQFKATLKNGVDLASPNLETGLAGSGVSKADLTKLDTNRDGVLKGGELTGAFKYVDSFDKNGSGSSFANAGKSGSVYGALLGSVRPPPSGGQISQAALDRASADKEGYAYDKSPTSPYPNLSGNPTPGTSRPKWLENQNKCNQFVGDALTQAGAKMPTYTMPNGTEHYVNAENLPKFGSHFSKVTDASQVRPGDVMVIDYPESGLSTAHTEVVTGNSPLKTTGAHADGAYETDRSTLLNGATFNQAGGHWEKNGNKIFFLRPTQTM